MKKILLIPLISLLMMGCITNIEDLTIDEEELPEIVSFSNDIQPIFNTSCGGAGCHVGSAANNVNLENYQTTMNSIGRNYGTEIVMPGDADGSPLVDKIEANPDIGSRMPLGRSPLTPIEIGLIRNWINDGAQDN